MEEAHQFVGHQVDDLVSRGSQRHELGHRVNEPDELGLLPRRAVEPLALHDDLGDHHANEKEADRRLQVGPVRDLEPPVRLGQQDVERERGHHRRHVAGHAVADGGHAHDDGDEQEGGRGGGEGGPEGDEHGSQPDRQQNGAHPGDDRTPAPEEGSQTVHGEILARRMQSRKPRLGGDTP